MNNINNIPFQATHSGKCFTCQDIKPLDAMLKKDYHHEYECIDCKVDNENIKYRNFENYAVHKKTIENVLNDVDVPVSKLRALIKWCFG